MICPKCKTKLKVMDTRSDNKGVYRRRKCPECLGIYFTSEVISDGDRYYKALSETRYKV